MVILGKYYDHKTFKGEGLKAFFEKYPIGGLFLPDWYYFYFAPKDSSMEYYIKESIKDYAANSRYPLIFMEDFERGLGLQYPESYTQMPVEMALGAAGLEQLAYRYGQSIAKEARDFGMNWLLHPVVDLNMNPLHSLVLERSISDDPDFALPLLKKQIAGLHSQDIITTIKHFPGDGATIRDQHLMTSQNPLSWEEWQKTYGKVFKELIAYEAPSIMVGHLIFPAYQKEKFNGNLLPASLSSELIIKLLKTEMNFNGVVISDALNMGGVAGYYANELETSIASFAAGVDLMLWPDLAFMDTLEARILRKEIPMERLDDAVQRIWAVKERFGLLRKPQKLFNPLAEQDRISADQIATETAEKAVTLIRGEKDSLPLDPKKSKKILLVNVSHTDKSQLFMPTKKLLEDKGFEVTLQYSLGYRDWNWRMDSLAYFDKIIACFENKYFDPVGLPFLKGTEAESVWMFNMLPKEKMICVSYSNPYYLNFYFQHIPVLINAYSSDRYMQEAVVKALTGEIPFRGKSPVKLDHDILK
ncbi:MAG: glycoside hydrolase family 3 protein [Calditrichaceae bacterium]|nr:glycoside hydrolase family 3 protein [Calditrichaceae bacterium]